MARPARRPGNLPAEATSFVGRRRELASLREKLAGGRLVCLTGPGGVGKTRLALRAAGELARGFPGGVWLVELAEVRDPALVTNAVLAALDLRDQAAADPASLLLSYLRDKRLLLVVDNCEHLLPAAARLLDEVLRSAPGVKVVATSRQPLSIQGEHLVPIPPLDLHNEAATLFAQRAAAASGGFELTEGNSQFVVDVCRRLDGLPLAIELAAVRTRVLSVRQILDRLTDRFRLLDDDNGRVALPRQRTLATTIDWSHDLLSDAERTLLRRLWVFAGRFTLDDVEQICDGTLEVLSSLVDKSLVLRVGDSAGPVACYRLHETMREYAAVKAREAGEVEEIEVRCARYYLDWCRRTGAKARYDLVEWLGWMEIEIDNIRGALQGCLARKDFKLGLDLAAGAGWYWITRATSEGVRWLDELLAKVGDNSHPLALFLRGFLPVLLSDAAAAALWLQRAAEACAQAGWASLESQTLSMASIAAHMGGDATQARHLLSAAEEIADAREGDYLAEIAVLQAVSLGGLMEGDLDRVVPASTKGLTLGHGMGDIYTLTMMHVNLGLVSLIRGEFDHCRPLLTEALRLARLLDDRVAQNLLLGALAGLAAGEGGFRLAARLLGAGDKLQTGVGASVLPYLAPWAAKARRTTIAALGTAGFQAEFEAGQRLDRQEALALAMGEPAPVAASEEGPLGQRQIQVAQLIADGLSNKQIAARLLISQHTVDTHVRNIMTRLGCRSRAQIAAWVASNSP